LQETETIIKGDDEGMERITKVIQSLSIDDEEKTAAEKRN
jgi:hypothetical protein